MSNAKKYNSYKDINLEDEDNSLAEYKRVDSYVKQPPGSAKNVGKLDNYSKDKDLYAKKKAKVHFSESKTNTGTFDDYVPETVGNAIDNVFSKVDSLLDATGKFFWGTKKPIPKQNLRPIQQTPKIQVNTQSTTKPQPQPVVNAQPQIKVQQQTETKPKPVVQKQGYYNNVQTTIQPQKHQVKSTKNSKVIDEEEDDIDRSPPVKRTTSISELDLSLNILNDPDLVRYFDQMKLYDKKVAGGLCSLSFNKASKRLSKGRWGKLFMISYDQLKINTMMASADAGLQRFNGMVPVYKALGRNFKNTEELKHAIEEDINLYLKTGQSSDKFHKFTYTVSRGKK